MRWFVWLVALCLMAAGVARPHAPRTLDRHDATVDDASVLATLVPRRPSVFVPDKRTDRRLDLHAGPAIKITQDLARAVLATSATLPSRILATASITHHSRGPPDGRSPMPHPLRS